MRRIALCLYALCLVLPMVGCKKEPEKTPAPATTPDATTTPPAEPAK